MHHITRINHVGLRVRNLAITRAFYERLGFIFLEGPVGPEPVAIMEHPSGVNINFILNASDDSPEENILMDVPIKHAGYTHIALEIDDIIAVQEHLDREEMAVTEHVKLPGGGQFLFIRDPDSNVIEFHLPAGK